MGPFLLSVFSAETLSWVGFIVLVGALIGEAGIWLIPKKREMLHAELAFALAVIAAGAYAIERIGDDSIIEALKTRATTAENELKVLSPRRLLGDDAERVRASLSAAPMHLPIGVVSRLFDSEGPDFADDIADVFKKAGWLPVRQKDWTLSTKGVFIATFEGTPLPPDVEKAIAGALDVASIPHKTIVITAAEQNTTSAHFQPNVLYLIVGAHP